MAETIKGINVVIGSETTGLQKALGDVNKKSRDIQSELKQVERLLKLDPSNTELLAQKQELLSNAVENTKEKLDRLKASQEQINEQFARGDITEGQYRAFQRELVATEQELSRLENSLNDMSNTADNSTENINDLGESTDKTNKSLKDIGESAATAAKVGIAAIGTAAVGAIGGLVKFSDDFNKSMNNFQSQTGYANDKMSEFKEIAKEIYANNFGESFDDIAESMAVINQTVAITGNELKNTTEQAILMRDTFGFEVNESINTVNSLMKNFGLTAEEAYNLLAQGAQMGANKNGDLLDIMNEYAPHFAQLGISAEEFTDTLIQGAASGAFQIDKVGDAVKEFGIRAKDGSETSAAGFQALGLNADQMFKTFAKGGPEAEKAFQTVIQKLGDMKDPMAQNQAGVALFGTMYEDLGIEAIKALGDIENYTNLDVNALEQINEVKYNDIGSALEGLKRQLLVSVAEPIGNELIPKINDMINSLKNVDVTPIVDGLKWIIDNANNIAAAAVAIGTGMAVWKVASTINEVVGAIKRYQTANEGATVAQAAMNLVMKDNPIGIIVTAIAALVAAIIYLWNTNEEFKNAIINAWTTVKDGALQIWNGIKDTITSAWEGIKNGVSTAIDTVKNVINTTWTNIMGITSTIVSAIVTFITEKFGWLANGLSTIIDGIKTMFQGQWELIKNIVLGVVLLILDLVTGNFTKLKEDASKILDNLKEAISTIWEGIKLVFSGALNIIKDYASNAWKGIKTITSTIWGEIKGVIESIWKGIIEFFRTLPGTLKTLGSNAFNSMRDGISNTLESVKSAAIQIGESIKSAFTDLPSKLLDIGKNIIQGLIDGIKAKITAVKDAITSVTDAITGKIRNILDIHSPSRVMMELGGYTGEGFALGIKSTIGEIARQSQAMAKAVNPSAKIGSIGINSSNGAPGVVAAQQTIIVPVTLDGQVIAKVIAPYSDIIQGKNLTLAGRGVGL